MQTRYTKTFKIEAVKKALSRSPGSNLTEVANTLGLPKSTLYGWVEAMKKREKTAPLSREGATEKNLSVVVTGKIRCNHRNSFLFRGGCCRVLQKEGNIPSSSTVMEERISRRIKQKT